MGHTTTVRLFLLLRATVRTHLRLVPAVKPGGGADPYVLRHNDAYYMTLSQSSPDISVLRTDNLAQWPSEGTPVYTPGSGWAEVWAPELHCINGSFYIYVAMVRTGAGK